MATVSRRGVARVRPYLRVLEHQRWQAEVEYERALAVLRGEVG